MFFESGTNDTDDTFASDHSAIITHSFYGCSNFHNDKIKLITNGVLCLIYTASSGAESTVSDPESVGSCGFLPVGWR